MILLSTGAMPPRSKHLCKFSSDPQAGDSLYVILLYRFIALISSSTYKDNIS